MKKVNSSFNYDARTKKVMQTWIQLLRSHKLISAKELAFISPQGLSKNQFEVLEALYHMGDMRIGELTKLIMSTPGNITVVVKNLTRDGLVELLQCSHDKRSFILSITSLGKEKISSMFVEHSLNLHSCFDSFDDEELDTMFLMLRRLYKHNKKDKN